MTFDYILMFLRNGEKAKRISWPICMEYLKFENGKLFVCDNHICKEFIPSIEDVEAGDWTLVL